MKKQWCSLLALLLCTVLLCAVLGGCAIQPIVLRPGERYVTAHCVFSNPLRNVYADWDGDVLCVIEEASFTYEHRVTADSGRIDDVSWGWQPFPYTDGEWAALYESDPPEDISRQYGTLLYQPMAPHLFLLQADEELWLVNLLPYGREGDPWRLWSIYALVPEGGS